jgi:hypothetical protein
MPVHESTAELPPSRPRPESNERAPAPGPHGQAGASPGRSRWAKCALRHLAVASVDRVVELAPGSRSRHLLALAVLIAGVRMAEGIGDGDVNNNLAGHSLSVVQQAPWQSRKRPAEPHALLAIPSVSASSSWGRL